jgi:simple sugar transport system ATP-binding protein
VTPVVSMRGITKRFERVTALDAVDLEVLPGTIHALVGENGAGKTTLMRILQGLLRPDAGAIELRGARRHWRRAADAIAQGIGMVSQHYSIIGELSCLQNLVLGAEPSAWIRWPSAEARAQELARSMGFSFDWHGPARELSPASAQKLEILKLLWRNASVMILDEPTAMLSPGDSDGLFQSLAQIVSAGSTVILVTHRLPEVMLHCHRVTVLRGGRKAADRDVSQTSAHELAELIVGRSLLEPPARHPSPGGVLLRVSGLTVLDARRHEALRGASLELRAGEVVGLAGVDGNGQRELFQAIVGTASPVEGEIELDGQDLAGRPTAERLALGVRLIPEDRHAEGVVADWSLEENAGLGLHRSPALQRRGGIRFAARRELALRVAERFQTRSEGIGAPMASLSGGNQQRFVASRALELGPRLVLAFQPVRGLDLAASQAVYAALQATADAGAAVLVVSFDLDELLANCDRVLAICHGRVFAPPPGRERDRAAIGRMMVGAS